MESWAKLARLSFPTGVPVGPDFSHPILHGKILRHVSIATGGLSSRTIYPNITLPTNTSVTGGFDGSIGHWVGPSSTTGHINFANQSTNADTSYTMGMIFRSPAAPAANGVLFTNNSAGNICTSFSSTAGALDIGQPFSTNIATGLTAAPSNAYFFAFSCITGKQAYALMNLQTGQLTTSTTSTTITISTPGGTVEWGDTGTSGQATSGARLAAFMFAAGQSSLDELIAWANDPWSFWYPQPDESWVGTTGVAVIEGPPHWYGRTYLPQWVRTGLFLQNTANDFSSSAVETNPHWQGKTYPPQWLADRKLLINHRAVVESSSAVETNPHTAFKTLPPQWVKNPILLINTAQDFSSSAVETNPHWKGIQWPPQWVINKPLFRVTAQDFSASAVETNVHAIFKTFPPQWLPLAKLRQTDPQDFSSSAVETNPHWLGKTWPPQWTLILKQSFDPNASTQVQPETNVHFIPRTYPLQWAPLKNLQNTAQDFSSSAVETNVHAIFKTWSPQWKQTINLLLNTDTLAPTFQPETNVHFIPRTWAPQWVLLLRTQNTAQDFSSSAVETNPHWIGRPWPIQWAPAIALRTAPATDVPAITFDTPPHTVFRTWLPQWLINLPLLRGTAQDFSSTAVETNVHFIPHTWPPQWNLQASLKQGTAQDFSTTPPTFIEIYENQFFSAFARIGAIGRNP